MRELKFRVWDETKKHWLSGDDYIGINNHGVIVNDRQDMEDLSLKHDAIIQQYTGIKDKNGKEMCEGDILSFAGSLMYEIVWNDKWARFSFLTITQQDGMYQLPDMEIRNSEIIGNIFETPHLKSCY